MPLDSSDLSITNDFSGSTMGSLTMAEKFSGFPLPAYKISKAALNALTVQWAHALAKEDFVVVSLNPGVRINSLQISLTAKLMWKQTVKTAMGGGDFADLTLEQAAKGVVEAIAKADSVKTGTFFMIEVAGWEDNPGLHQYNGKICSW